MDFSAQVGNRSLVFSSPSPSAAYHRAKKWESEEKLKRLYLHRGSSKQVIWEPTTDYGVVGEPPRSWKWWFKQIFHHCFYHPFIPLFLVIKAIFPKFSMPQHIEPN